MKTIYAVIYSPINAVSQERLNLGLIMISDGGVKFEYSQRKLNLAKDLFSENGLKLIKSYLASIEKKLTPKEEIIDSLADFKSGYLDYLSNFNNNLVAFSKPQSIDIELNNVNFRRLFEKFVFENPPEVHAEAIISDIVKLKEAMIPRVEKRMNVDVDLHPENFDFVLFDLHVDMMGKNDRAVLNQFINFNTTPQALENKINRYLSIIKPLEIYHEQAGKFFLVGNEPSKELTKQHLAWKHLMSSPLVTKDILEIVQTSEFGKIEEYLESHDVKPYFPEED